MMSALITVSYMMPIENTHLSPISIYGNVSKEIGVPMGEGSSNLHEIATQYRKIGTIIKRNFC